ncbi:DUF421 domain-containing protein [Litoreibacter roseus]|uniref:DUF421 domain-containing protein n=1 Tax=Litoreibacter roseus TaxID=2601869 RepID=A0A6N6JBZ6_9RHOB|nr:YetF domain-containing protein [Litoreibacter roseus]GFE63594.1 DUF421 domain-containing protein [Litoreibacter roseus]
MPSLSTLALQIGEALMMVAVIILLTRIAGLRSFSKMSGFDFAITVAMGSVLASVVVGTQTSVVVGVVALAALFGVQAIVAQMRMRWSGAERLLDNAPLLIMKDGEILEENMRQAEMTRSDLIAKLREANVLRIQDVRAVVAETTGDVSVLHGDSLEDDLLEGVRS